MAAPVVVGEHAQPTTGSGEEPQPLFRSQYIIFESQSKPPKFVEVLAGEGAPTPSGGYAKWARVQRPQRVALTIHEGYEPMSLTVPVLFDAVRQNGVREDCENQIQWLEWMAGRGVKHVAPFTVGVGKPPLVVVYSADGAGNRATPLVPKPFQTANLKWFIEDITWDEHPLKDAGGARIRQAATVKLVQHVEDPVIPGGPSGPSYKTFRTTAALDTVRKLVLHYAKGTPAHRQAAIPATIQENSFNKKIGTNPHKHLPAGTPVRVPKSYLTA